MDVKAAQYFIGHSDIRMTMDLYTHFSQERNDASRKQMVSLFDSWVNDRMKEAGAMPTPAQWSVQVLRAKLPEDPYN